MVCEDDVGFVVDGDCVGDFGETGVGRRRARDDDGGGVAMRVEDVL